MKTYSGPPLSHVHHIEHEYLPYLGLSPLSQQINHSLLVRILSMYPCSFEINVVVIHALLEHIRLSQICRAHSGLRDAKKVQMHSRLLGSGYSLEDAHYNTESAWFVPTASEVHRYLAKLRAQPHGSESP